MTRRRKIILVIVAVAILVLGGLAWLIVRGPREPSYQGKSLSTWLARLDQIYAESRPMMGPTGSVYPSTPERSECEEAIRHIGTNAVPFLLPMLSANDSPFRSKLVQLTGKQHLTKYHLVSANERRRLAVRAFEVLGPDAKTALPKLAEVFAKAGPSDRIEIGRCLVFILPSFPWKSLSWSDDSPHFNFSGVSHVSYELSRDDLVKALGPPATATDEWFAYDLGDLNPSAPGPHMFLLVEFSNGRVVGADTTLMTGAKEANSPITIK